MAYAKKRKSGSTTKKHSSKLHVKKFRIPTPAELGSAPYARKITIGMICVSILAVIFSLCCSIFFNPERLAKLEIKNLASDYYENYFYDNFANSQKFINLEDIDAAMDKYVNFGFAKVSLRQLLLRGGRDNSLPISALINHCNENETFVKFYPESPYSETSYHTEYTYSCDF